MASRVHVSKRVPSVACAVLTVSDTRTQETDESGALIRRLLEGAGHTVVSHQIIKDDLDAIRAALRLYCDHPRCQAVLLTGGTGIAPRDCTVEAASEMLEKRIDGFGELFRALSYEQVGPLAMLSRAIAGVCNHTVVLSMPGSTDAVTLAMERLILPELGHIVWLLGDRKSSS